MRARDSLITSTLRVVALRISLVIALTAALSYLHITEQIQKTALQTLERYVHERSLREREIFRLAQDNHRVMRQELNEVFRQVEASTYDPQREFSAMVRRDPDGALRAPRAKAGVKKELDIWIAKTAKVTPLLRRKVVSFSKVLLRYGPAFHARFTDTYVALGENANLVYWPEFPDWSAGNAADFDFPSYELYAIGARDKNPERKTLWSGVYFDDAIKEWMVSASTPIDDRDGNFSGIIGHDVMIGDLIKRTTNEGLPGTYNILIAADGRIIAHPKKMIDVTKAKGNLKVADTQDKELEDIYAQVRAISPEKRNGETILDHKDFDQFIAVSHMPETGWDFIVIYPKSLIRNIADRTVMFIVLLGVLSLAVELFLLFFILRDKIAKPLGEFLRATRDIESGQATTPLQTARADEIGALSRSFESMAKKIRSELLEVQRIATQNAHAAGMAEVATNILHNIGNTINSVNLSALEMEKALENSHLKNLERALRMLEENRAHLSDFLQNDPKGKMLGPYLTELAGETRRNQESALQNFHFLLRKIKMIEDIVVAQQQYVKRGSFIEQVDLVAIVEECAMMLNLSASGVPFRFTHGSNVPPVWAQRVKVTQIVLNLLKNALESVQAAKGPPSIDVRLEPQDAFVSLTVQDSGGGIDPANLDKIFRHGFTTKPGGHGFGLHFCALAARELGGSLQAQSEGLGKGASFTLRLPIRA